jgi:hypothetical protein
MGEVRSGAGGEQRAAECFVRVTHHRDGGEAVFRLVAELVMSDLLAAMERVRDAIGQVRGESSG